jgi:hypothetical protein
MGHIKPYSIEELRHAIQLNELGSLMELGATPEVTDTIRVSGRVLSNLRPTKEKASKNLAFYSSSGIWIPAGPQMYVQNNDEYRIAFTAGNVIYGRVAGADELNEYLASIGKREYSNFVAVLSLSSDEKVSGNGYFSLFLDVNAQQQASPEYIRRAAESRDQNRRMLRRLRA